MKKTLSLLTLCSALAVAHADVIHFNLATNGLNVLNVVPAVTNSTGSGDAISGGLWLQTTNSTFTFAFGYGAGAGFTNLTGAATAVSLNGPTPAGSNAAVVVGLAAFTFPAVEPTNGGVVFGSVVLTPEQASNLLHGLDYIVIATDNNTNGEIRGQLVPVTGAGPALVCPGDATLECTGLPVPLTARVTSASGNALTVTWMVNQMNVQTNHIAANAATNALPVMFAASLKLGTNLVTVTVVDSAGNETSCDSTIIVQDTIAPVITKVTASPASLWPPNHKLVPVNINVAIKEACCLGDWRILSVTSNEAIGSGAEKKGSGNTLVDWTITGNHGLTLRAERAGTGKGRSYTITVQAQDCSGNLSLPATFTVTVPHNQ